MFNIKNKIGFLLVGLLSFVFCLIEAQGQGDFYIFISASGDLSRHNNIFVNKYLVDYHYYYSVLFALLLKPFYYLPFYWVKFGWLILNITLYFHLFGLLTNSIFVERLSNKQKTWFLLCVFIFSSRFLRENIHTSQTTILILWCSVYGILRIHQNKNFSGAMILALGINIKVLPLVLLPYLLYRAYYKGFLFTLFFCFAFLMIPSVIIGHDYNMDLIRSWFDLLNPTHQEHVLDVDERSFHSLTTLLSVLLVEKVPDPLAMDIKRNILDIPLAAFFYVSLLVRLSLISFVIYFLGWKPFKKASSSWQQMVEIAYILLLVPLVFPHQQHYAFLYTVPAFAIVLYYAIINFQSFGYVRKRCVISLLTLIYLTANLKILLGEFNRYYEHFKILTYGALLLIPGLVWVWRKSKEGLASKGFSEE